MAIDHDGLCKAGINEFFMDSQQIERLGEDILDFKEKADRLAWFNTHSAASPAS